ncbi:MAG: hypothetical protein GC136_07315 [Alphaproteobacteria bacterium]|nr:hypothetical protein [Alphaproteobacteria bacterium]
MPRYTNSLGEVFAKESDYRELGNVRVIEGRVFADITFKQDVYIDGSLLFSPEDSVSGNLFGANFRDAARRLEADGIEPDETLKVIGKLVTLGYSGPALPC